jgi:hypothetical protein
MVHLGSRSLRNNCRNFTTPSTKKFYNGVASGEILLWWVGVTIAGLFTSSAQTGRFRRRAEQGDWTGVRRLLG